MKFYLPLVVLAFNSPAFAGVVDQFHCQTENPIESRGHRAVTRFDFKVNNLEQGKISYVESDDPNGIDGPVMMNPENSVLMLNDNYGIKRIRTQKDIVLDSDGDGIQFTTVRLYADSSYRSGYAQVKFSSENRVIYTKVSCQVRRLRN